MIQIRQVERLNCMGVVEGKKLKSNVFFEIMKDTADYIYGSQTSGGVTVITVCVELFRD